MIIGIVVVVVVIGFAGYAVMRSHADVANQQSKSQQQKTAAQLQNAAKEEADAKKQPTPTPVTPPAAVSTKVSPAPQTSATPTSRSSVTQQPAPTVATAHGTIMFSADGCQVTASGTPGLLLSGNVMTSNRHKGGPLISPDGLKIPDSGTVTSPTVQSQTSFDYSTYVIDATLTDAAGTVVTSASTSITAHSCQ